MVCGRVHCGEGIVRQFAGVTGNARAGNRGGVPDAGAYPRRWERTEQSRSFGQVQERPCRVKVGVTARRDGTLYGG